MCTRAYTRDQAARGITVSMSRKGDCWDNAPMESANGTVKVECVHGAAFKTRAEAAQALMEYFGYYNTERMHSSLGYLYLLRNLSKGRGVGFFEAGNFHPDFIVWQLTRDRQQVAFVDPKGIRNVGLQDPKIGFFETVKEIEQRLGDASIVLDSFIVSNTPSHVMRKQWGIGKAEMARRHIVFQDEDKDAYIEAILQTAAGGDV